MKKEKFCWYLCCVGFALLFVGLLIHNIVQEVEVSDIEVLSSNVMRTAEDILSYGIDRTAGSDANENVLDYMYTRMSDIGLTDVEKLVVDNVDTYEIKDHRIEYKDNNGAFVEISNIKVLPCNVNIQGSELSFAGLNDYKSESLLFVDYKEDFSLDMLATYADIDKVQVLVLLEGSRTVPMDLKLSVPMIVIPKTTGDYLLERKEKDSDYKVFLSVHSIQREQNTVNYVKGEIPGVYNDTVYVTVRGDSTLKGYQNALDMGIFLEYARLLKSVNTLYKKNICFLVTVGDTVDSSVLDKNIDLVFEIRGSVPQEDAYVMYEYVTDGVDLKFSKELQGKKIKLIQKGYTQDGLWGGVAQNVLRVGNKLNSQQDKLLNSCLDIDNVLFDTDVLGRLMVHYSNIILDLAR